MSQENVELVRQIFDAAARHDAETVFAHYDREIEWDSSRVSQGGLVGWGGVYRGHDSLRSWFRDWGEGLIKDEAKELIAAGDQVVSKATMRWRAHMTAIEVEGTLYAVWTIREGKVVRVVWFPTRKEALEAAGPRE
jgi:ketosteroid isomerase-like protein